MCIRDSLLTFGGGRYLVQRFVEELATHYHVSVTVEDVTPLFLGFVLRNVAVEGKGFSFRAPSLCARLSWTRGITLVIVDGEFSLPRGYSFPLESLPPFLLEIRKGRFAEFPDVLWDGRFEKSGDCLRFRVTAGDLDLAGDIRGEVVTVLSPFQGTFSLKTGAFSGVFKDVRFEGMLSRKGDAWQIAPFLVMGTEGTFSGKCVFHKDMLFDLSGNVCAFGMEMPFTLSGRLAFPLLEGEFRSEGLLGRVVADLLRASYRLTIYPQSVWQDCRVSGILEGRFREGFAARFRDFSVDIPQREISFAFSGELEGKGDILRGSVRLRNFTGRIKGWELSEGEFVVCLDGPRVSFSGQGKLFGGCVNLSGEYGKGRFWVLGKAKDIPVERVVGKSDVPLSGVISGDFSLEGEWDNLKISLALNDGHLFLQGRDLGSVASGKAEVRGDAFFLKDLLLVRKGGRFSGTFVKGATGIQGEGTFDAYPLEFSWQGRDIRVLLHGSVAFRWGEERFLRFALSAPSWSFGAFEGRDLHAIGELQDGRVTLERLSLLWDGGFLKVQGNFVPGKAVHLEGEVENLRIPEKDFPVSGTVEKARFLVSGPWEDVCWVLEGKGSSLRTADFPLGEEVILKLSGRVSLARVFEGQSPVLEVLHPENLTEGSITVRRVNLALFGGTFFSKVPGTFDMYLVLDRQKRLWRFSSDTVIFSFPPYGSFKVGFQGTYDGQRLVLENVRVEGEQGTVLSGKGNIDVATRSLDLWVSGRIKTLLSFGDYRIDLEAEGQWHAFGDVVFPLLEGSLYLPRVRIFGGSREYLVLEDLRGEMAGDA
ncbi:MAG: hypothetical protein N2205_02480, partial [Candidatus Caldatribacterium sp.]|nr:hypothetical protein [Candidatus Caldatribacterium sp.]